MKVKKSPAPILQGSYAYVSNACLYLAEGKSGDAYSKEQNMFGRLQHCESKGESRTNLSSTSELTVLIYVSFIPSLSQPHGGVYR
jgi:hypothetical protein